MVRGAHGADWGSGLDINDETRAVTRDLRGRQAELISPEAATDYQRQIVKTLREKLRLRPKKNADVTVMIGPPAFNSYAIPVLCREDILRVKYDSGLAGFVRFNPERRVLHIVGLSDFGDRKLIDWLNEAA